MNNVRRPVILVEGFDPNDDFAIPDIYDIMDFGSPFSIADQLHNAGFDIIILNFDNGGDLIQRNAFLLVELINQVNANKPHSEPLVVVGFSMGGLVSRYALTYMEENGMNHESRLYVSFDSPHKGAHVPVGIQALATTFDSDFYKSLFPDLTSSLNQFTAPAAKQMLKYRIDDPTEASGELPINPDHQSFLNDLEGLNDCNGFPTTCRNIAISLGSWNGVGQRSNLDLDSDGTDDLQHAAFPMLYINIPQGGGGDEPQAIWELNQCEAIAVFSFQIFLSTSYSSNYPYFSDRSSYGGLGDWAYATYWYRNSESPFQILFPYGAWSRLWWYQDEEPMDFAPGAFVPAYDDILDALNSQIDCHFGYAENSTFVPTVSALAFDTDNLFFDIEADANRLDKTPFDNIIGITGDNTSHRDNQTTNAQIVNWLLNEINNTLGTTCAKNLESISGTINNGENVSISDVSNIEASNYTIKNGASVDLTAGNSITLLPGFSAELGSEFSAKIQPCGPKPCSWQPSTSSLKSSRVSQIIDTNLVIKSAPLINTNINPKNIADENKYIKVFPNPSNGNFYIYTTVDKGKLQIINSVGKIVNKQRINFGYNEINLDEPSGIYQIIVIDKNNNIYNEKLMKQ